MERVRGGVKSWKKSLIEGAGESVGLLPPEKSQLILLGHIDTSGVSSIFIMTDK